jgi:hypothetical protein
MAAAGQIVRSAKKVLAIGAVHIRPKTAAPLRSCKIDLLKQFWESGGTVSIERPLPEGSPVSVSFESIARTMTMSLKSFPRSPALAKTGVEFPMLDAATETTVRVIVRLDALQGPPLATFNAHRNSTEKLASNKYPSTAIAPNSPPHKAKTSRFLAGPFDDRFSAACCCSLL